MILEYILTAALVINVFVIIGTITIVRIVVKDLSDEPRYDIYYLCERGENKYTKDIGNAVNFKKMWYGYREKDV